MNFPTANEMVSVRDLLELNKALRKSATVGYQTPATTSGGDAGNLSPLVPQSLEGTLASATFTMQELVLWPAIPKRNVDQTVHEYTVVQEHGMDVDPFIAEGGGGVNNQSLYERRSVRVKYLAERREVTDVASMVGLVGPNANAIAEETERGTISLMRKVEVQLFHGDEDLNENGFDGILKQVEEGGNFTDLLGEGVSVDRLQETLGTLQSAPYFGRPDCIYLEPKVHQDLVRQAVVYGRHDQVKVGDGTKLTFGSRNLELMSPYGPIPLKSAPFLFTAWPAPTSGSGGTNAPATPVFVAAGGAGVPQHDAGLTGTSGWEAGDAGDYFYKIVAVSDGGYSAPLTSSAITISASDKIRIRLDDNALKAGTYKVKYYRLYRGDKDGLVGTCKLLMEIPVNTDGGGSNTQLEDYNAVKPNTSKMLITEHNPNVMQVVRLLDFLRRPLAEVATTKPFLLMLFMVPIVKVPTKCWMLKNVGINPIT